LNVGSVFSGDGLLDFGLTLAGWEHAFLCESEPERREILSLRWPGVPIYRDVREVDGSAPRVDLLAGGFPCKGASVTGDGTGLDHPETALWREMARIIGVLRPGLVLIENVANLLGVARSKGEPPGTAWGEVSGDLAALGYVFAWDCLPAAAFGAPHLRDRVFCVAADPVLAGLEGSGIQGPATDRVEASPDASWDAEGGTGSPAGSNGQRARARDYATSHPNRERRQQESRGAHADESPDEGRPMEHDHKSRCSCTGGVPTAVEWGGYEPAIRRWEEVAGPAPAPLLRGVDDRRARRVVRSRLSALGDGVHVQAGHFLGAKLMELALEMEFVHDPN
jgi:site-specific DNA-cytosine methylase